jgi:hypothetical protein
MTTPMHSCEWLLTDDTFMKPSYRISPFTTGSIAANSHCPPDAAADEYFSTLLARYQQTWVRKAREAITLALVDLNLTSEDTVTIITTSQNRYVSGCVTKAIEQVCQWDRTLSVRTKAILVIHEFGAIVEDLESLYARGIPIIEDYAHAFHSTPLEGIKGDYVIYSFPKYFSIQYGGILLSKRPLQKAYTLSPSVLNYLKAVISHQLKDIEFFRQKRVANHHYLTMAFKRFGCSPRFAWKINETPSVFIFHVPSEIPLPALKTFVQEHGIESSVFYGEQVFFIPVHHGLEQIDLDYFIFVYQHFLIKNGIHYEI